MHRLYVYIQQMLSIESTRTEVTFEFPDLVVAHLNVFFQCELIRQDFCATGARKIKVF